MKYLILFFSFSCLSYVYSGTLTDNDGNTYNTIVIGSQTWMQENLRTTTLNDGSEIDNITDINEWANNTTPAYCWFKNDDSYKNSRGALYNWFTAESENICPTGWKVPSTDDWQTLITYLGGNNATTAKKMSSTEFGTGTNESLLNLNTTSIRFSDGEFENIDGSFAAWWTNETKSSDIERGNILNIDDGSFMYFPSSIPKHSGLAIRCMTNIIVTANTPLLINPQFKLSYNANTQNLYVNNIYNENTSIKIYNLQGQHIKTEDNIKANFDVSHFETSIYIAIISNEQTSCSFKFIKD